MSDYTKIVDYAAKDALITGNPVKLVKGTELGAEYDAISVAIATKANTASPAFTGVSGFAVGAVGAPSIYMTGYATTGWYNIGANNWGFAVSGAKVLDIASTGLAIAGTLSASGTTTLARVNQSNGSIDFSSLGNGSTSWQIGTQTALKPLDIFTGGAVRAQFSDTGLAVTGTTSTTTGMAVGGATAGAGGIAFPATAVAVADANTLDDYEEGTWTIGVSFGAGTTGITYAVQAGSYTKIGNRVFCAGKVELTNKGSSTGQARITGLPFTAAFANANLSAPTLRVYGITFSNVIQGYVEGGTATIFLDECTNGGVVTGITDANFSNTSLITFSVNYYV